MQRLEESINYNIPRREQVDKLGNDLQELAHSVFNQSDTGRRAKDFLNGVWLGHPMHPAVTDVPVGAWTAALALDGIEVATGRDLSGATSKVIGVGIGGALISAASGVADWVDTSGPTRRVGLLHALLNSVSLSMYVLSLLSRALGRRGTGRVLSLAGFLSAVGGAYLGGDLVFRLGNQVDRNAWTPKIAEFKRAVAEADLVDGKPVRAEVDGVAVLLVRHDGHIYALGDNCSHMGCSLSSPESEISEGKISCWCHGSTYQLADGIVVRGPAAFPQPSYEVRVENGQIEVRSATT
jgi:nitrite reductase/ring-hydroxylating ferredoxin subunit/uncharacterized membrane protein